MFVLQIHRAVKMARETREALRLKKTRRYFTYLLIKSSGNYLYLRNVNAYYTTALSPEPKNRFQ
jgi:hypothetical protein